MSQSGRSRSRILCVQLSGYGGQLSQIALSPELFVTHVALHVEVRVVRPPARAERAPELVEPLPQTGDTVYATGQEVADDMRCHRATVNVMGPQDHEGADVLGEASRLEVKKSAILGAQPVGVAGQCPTHSCLSSDG